MNNYIVRSYRDVIVVTNIVKGVHTGARIAAFEYCSLFVLEHERLVHRTRSPRGVSRSFGK